MHGDKDHFLRLASIVVYRILIFVIFVNLIMFPADEHGFDRDQPQLKKNIMINFIDSRVSSA